ncbi:MAG: anthranilate phosphoribosyltransferase [Candidatus Peregrinibacteria bacterium]|nr:anthranilate phosphoribosyltransferase [Candidatus Peregrinibacteria bacterium]
MNIQTFLEKSINNELSLETQINFLRDKKDITSKGLATAVKFLMEKMAKRSLIKNAIDICGTGGSGLQRINTSTISAFILAAAGVKIAKHGNKAASGRFGSFDLLESIGIDFSNNKAENLNFLYARDYHPLMKHFAEVRKEIGTPTFFNLLGPLLNPAATKKQIIGTSFKDKMGLIAETCRLIGKEKVYVVCGEDGLDEVTLTGKTFILELNEGKITNYTISPKDFGIQKSKFSEIKSGSPKQNTAIAIKILKGECKTRHVDLVLMNAGLALKLVGKVESLKEGYTLAKQIIETGLAFEKYQECKTPDILKQIINKIPNLQKSDRDFYGAINKRELSLIAEIKRKSPSKGMIAEQDFLPSKIAKNYEKSGADAISVVCEKNFFGGSLKYMKQARKNTYFTPILCKDFIIHEYQIYEARKYGADAILLIAAILTETKIKKFTGIAKDLNMDVLCEVHTFEELQKVLKTTVKIIGINNRDLRTFEVDLKTTERIAKHIPKDRLIVSESGIFTKEDIKNLPKRTNAILVGTSLMKGTPVQKLVSTKIKICGVRTGEVAKFCEKNGVDFVGLNFVPTSKRKIDEKKLQELSKYLKNTKKVGIFQNQPLKEVNNLSKNLDFIQLCGNESIEYIKKCKKPVIKTIPLKNSDDVALAEKYYQHVTFICFDGVNPGSGKSFDYVLIKDFDHPFFISGGINSGTLNSAMQTAPICIDIASGVETGGQIDTKKITEILNQLKLC